MDERLNVGEKFFIVQDWHIMRYTVVAVVNVEDENGVALEYRAVGPKGEKKIFPATVPMASFVEAKELAREAWNMVDKQQRDGIETLEETFFDELEEKAKEARAKLEEKK